MPLTKKKATTLYKTLLANRGLHEQTRKNRRDWDGMLAGDLHLSVDNELDQTLLGLRKASLDRKSVEIDVEGEKIRVYPHSDKNIDSDIHDIFARGLDAARAVNEILANRLGSENHMLKAFGKDGAKKTLVGLIQKFQDNMKVHLANKNPEKAHSNALKELKRFHGSLSDFLVKQGIIDNRSQANQAINFVRDFLWKRDIGNIPHCVVEGIPPTMLRYAEPMKFGVVENPRFDLWHGDQPWKRKLAQKVGGEGRESWLTNFFKKNLADLRTLSSTPMSRFTPNPANAFDCTDIQVKDERVTSLSHHSRIAVTEPLSVGATASRQKITDWNHMQLLNKKRLESELNAFMEHWGSVYGKEESIPFTILHQTLIGDEVTFSPDQQKAKKSRFQASVIDSKMKANEAVRSMLAKSVILRNKESGKILFVSKKDYDATKFNGKWQEVKVNLLETNNCINMWGFRARVRNRDINDSRRLINNSVDLFTKINAKYNHPNLTTVIEFLKSSDHSWFTPDKFRGEKVKQAVKELTKQLQNTTERRENLALSLQAAVELKCTVHETWPGSLRRNIDNFTRDYLRTPYLLGLGHIADWTIRGVMGALAFVGRGISAIFSPQQRTKHAGDRKEIFTSAYTASRKVRFREAV